MTSRRRRKSKSNKPGAGKFQPGNKVGIGGRPKGAINRVTRDVRRVIQEFAENKAPDFEGWIERIARKNPARAADLFLRAIEYHIPKVREMPPPGGQLELAERLAGRLALPMPAAESTTLYLALLTAVPPAALPVTVDSESTPTEEEAT